MIEYQYEEEKIVALFFADLLKDSKSKSLLESGEVTNSEDATHLSKFYWNMVDLSAANQEPEIELPCDGSSQYWTEKLLNSFSAYLENVGFEDEWNTEVDNA